MSTAFTSHGFYADDKSYARTSTYPARGPILSLEIAPHVSVHISSGPAAEPEADLHFADSLLAAAKRYHAAAAQRAAEGTYPEAVGS